jgi:superfamily II DNA or RNA helicase
MEARDYQDKAIKAAVMELQYKESTVAVSPTGTGKTVIAVGIMKHFLNKKILFLAHREEIIFQSSKAIKAILGIDCGIELANNKSNGSESVIVASVQSMLRRMHKFNPDEYGLIIRDEAHHITSKTDRDIIKYFQQNKSIKLLGITATPDRGDEQAIGQIFRSMCFEMTLAQAFDQGWLVPVVAKRVELPGLDLSNARVSRGELNQMDLSAQMEKDRNITAIVDDAIWRIGTKKTIAFTASVLQARLMTAYFNRRAPGIAFYIDGDMKKKERRQKLQDFRDGKHQIFCNCGIATEGFDCPDASCILMAKPTLVRSAYAQMAGRGLRPLSDILRYCGSAGLRKLEIERSDKPHCLIIDYTTNSTTHKLMKAADIFAGDMEPDEKETSNILGNGKTIAQSNKGMWQVRGIGKGDTNISNFGHAGLGRLKHNTMRFTAQRSMGGMLIRDVFKALFTI